MQNMSVLEIGLLFRRQRSSEVAPIPDQAKRARGRAFSPWAQIQLTLSGCKALSALGGCDECALADFGGPADAALLGVP
jgi:hypothetical protein